MHALDSSCTEVLKFYSFDYDEEMHHQIHNSANRSLSYSSSNSEQRPEENIQYVTSAFQL